MKPGISSPDAACSFSGHHCRHDTSAAAVAAAAINDTITTDTATVFYDATIIIQLNHTDVNINNMIKMRMKSYVFTHSMTSHTKKG